MYTKRFQRIICLLTAVILLGTAIPLPSAQATASVQVSEPAVVTEAVKAAEAVSVPAISAPFTAHPVVFMVEDDYQIAFATNTTGLAWVEVDGVKYEDASAGLMNWNSLYHKVTVPQSALDAAGGYYIYFRELTDRPASNPSPGTTHARAYPFTPAPEDPVLLAMSDQHGEIEDPAAVAATQEFDVLIFGGDFAHKLETEAQLHGMFDIAGGITQGTKPVIYSRGNHEVRGPLSYKLDQVSGYSETTGAYYTTTLPGIYTIVLDAGEDKADSHAEYGGTVDFEAYRQKETEWLESVVLSREWENYPVRIAICHIPFTHYQDDFVKSVYEKWTDLLDRMGVTLVISGHLHYTWLRKAHADWHYYDPNFSVMLVSDKDQAASDTDPAITYSGSFLTFEDNGIHVNAYNEQKQQIKQEWVIPYVVDPKAAEADDENDIEETDVAQIIGTEAEPQMQTRASVVAPFTSHPAVFAVEDTYQIIFSTNATGMAWVEIGGVKYTDAQSGLMNWASKYHRITVPMSALDIAKSYTICFQAMSNRASYNPTHEATKSATYSFTPMQTNEEPTVLSLSNIRGDVTKAVTVAQKQSFDLLYINGDYNTDSTSEANAALILSIAGELTGGSKPIIYTRGNRENRGSYAYMLDEIAPFNPGTGSYYTAKLHDIYAIILDSGEDKADSNAEYGGTVSYEAYRREQTQWLQELYESGEWKNYPTRLAFCHIPFTKESVTEFQETYAQWTELLDKMGISMLISGHENEYLFYEPDSEKNVSEPSFPVLISSDSSTQSGSYYSGTFVSVGADDISTVNVQDSSANTQTVLHPNLTATDYWENCEDYILIDFNNDAASRERYQSPIYGGLNFDLKSSWTMELDVADLTVADGALSYVRASETTNGYGVYSRTSTSADGQWDYKTLHYVPKQNDCLQVRVMITDAVSTRSDGTATFRMDMDCPNTTSENKTYTRFTYDFNVSEAVNQGYFTITIPLDTAAYLEMDWISLLHPQFVDVESASGKTASFQIDYIYIGQPEHMPQYDEYLLFDFTDTDYDRLRYNEFTYNYTNFDDPANWEGYNGSPIVSVRDEALELLVAVGNTDSKFSARSRSAYPSTLHYFPKEGDYIEVRLKIENAVATATDGTATLRMDLDRPNTVNDRQWTSVSMNFSLSEHTDGEYFILRTEITDAEYMASDWIRLVHPVFLNMKSSADAPAKFTIDYIYLGPESALPSNVYTVSFCAEDGTVLETMQVQHGKAAIYSGEMEKKPDDVLHYTFNGWKNELGEIVDIYHITSDVKLYPNFDRQAHTFEYTYDDERFHTAQCACGYVRTEEHVFEGGLCICDTQKDSQPIVPESIDVVIDYAKPIQVDVRSRAMATGVPRNLLAAAPMSAELADPNDAAYGTFKLLDTDDDGKNDDLIFTPTAFLPKIVTVNCIFRVTIVRESGTTEHDVAIPVQIVPATSVYYETEFSEDAIDLQAVNTDSQWTTVTEGEAEEDAEQQDSGTVEANSYDFSFDRGGEIPSNAFYADFNGYRNADMTRYTTVRTYKPHDDPLTYKSYDDVSSWAYNTNHQEKPVIDTDEGTLYFKLKNNTRTLAYVQASGNLTSSFWLNYQPDFDHYFQIRFKMKNVKGLNADGTGTLRMNYYVGSNHTEDKNDGEERDHLGGSVTIPKDAFTSGEYITLYFPLSGLDPSHVKITAFRVTFDAVQSVSESELGEFTVDYIYCGPDNTKNDAPAMNHTSDSVPFMYFNFNNDAYAQRRYKGSLTGSYYGNVNLDTGNWVIDTNTPTNTTNNKGVVEAPTSIGGGYLTARIGTRSNSSGEYGTYIAPTKTAGEFPHAGSGHTSKHVLNFTPNQNGHSTYAIINFKLTGCQVVSGKDAHVQFSVINSAGDVKHPYSKFDLTQAAAGFITVKVDLTQSIQDLGGTITSFYFRFRNVKNAGSSYGQLQVDWIYIGPEDNASYVHTNQQLEKNLLIDFRNTNYDKNRYIARAYGSSNFDQMEAWNNTYWFNYSFNTNPGYLRLTPTSNYGDWGQIEANTSNRDALLSYYMTGNDYVVVRVRHNGLNTSGGTPQMRFLVGTTYKAGLPNDSSDANYPNVKAKYLDVNLDVSNNGKWVTYTFNLAEHKDYLGSWISYFRIIFNDCGLNSGGSFDIDYIYIGSLVNGAPPEESLYYGFDDTLADRERYDSATYGYHNYDEQGAAKFTLSSSVESAEVNSEFGVMTMTAADGSDTSFYFEPQENTSYHTKEKAIQIRFKTEDFVSVDGTNPYFALMYGKHNDESAKYEAMRMEFDAKYLSSGKYVTLTFDLTEENASFFSANVATKLRFCFGGMKNAEGKQGRITVDYVYLGSMDVSETTQEITYGFDSTYTDDSVYSDGSSYFVEGAGIPKLNADYSVNESIEQSYTVATFEFTGTGIDIISRTGENQGLIRLMIFDRDGELQKSAQVLSKSVASSDIYQVPVLSVEGLPHGTYTAKIYVAAAYDYGEPGNEDDFGGMLDRGGEFYFDAVRIHNTIDVNARTRDAIIAAEVYQRDGEANAVVTEIRNMLITDGYAFADSTAEGFAFIDKDSETMTAYTESGPNNEVYLNADNAIAFKIEVDGKLPASIDIGLKSANGQSATANIGISTDVPTAIVGGKDISITSATMQYYPIDISAEQWKIEDGKSSVYIIISNNTGMLSLTDIKCAYDAPTADDASIKSVKFLVDAQMLEALQTSEPVFEEALSLSMDISVGAEMQVVYTVRNAQVKSYDSFYVEVVKDVAGGESVKTVFSPDNGNLEEKYAPNGTLVGYAATYTGIFAAEMGDSFTATLYAVEADGTIHYGASESSSIKSYLMEKLADSTSTAELKALAVDMLNYGSAAQVNFDYDAQNLVNADLTDEQKALGTQEIPSATDSCATAGDGGRITTSVSLQSKVLLYVNCSYAKTENSNLEFVVKNLNGDVLERFAPTVAAAKMCQGVYGNVGARQMRDLITIELYDNGVLVSQTLTWNIESYVAQTREASASSDALIATVNAMLAYGDSAAIYLTASGQ